MNCETDDNPSAGERRDEGGGWNKGKSYEVGWLTEVGWARGANGRRRAGRENR